MKDSYLKFDCFLLLVFITSKWGVCHGVNPKSTGPALPPSGGKKETTSGRGTF